MASFFNQQTLATSTRSEIAGTCRHNFIIAVGFDWDHSDERKLQYTYGVGRDDLFNHFIDVKKQAEEMGYHQFGVKSLARLMFDFDASHPKNVSFYHLLV